MFHAIRYILRRACVGRRAHLDTLNQESRYVTFVFSSLTCSGSDVDWGEPTSDYRDEARVEESQGTGRSMLDKLNPDAARGGILSEKTRLWMASAVGVLAASSGDIHACQRNGSMNANVSSHWEGQGTWAVFCSGCCVESDGVG